MSQNAAGIAIAIDRMALKIKITSVIATPLTSLGKMITSVFQGGSIIYCPIYDDRFWRQQAD